VQGHDPRPETDNLDLAIYSNDAIPATLFRAIESELEAAARITRRIDDFLDMESLSQDHAELYQVPILLSRVTTPEL
jgi:hypothetical protein